MDSQLKLLYMILLDGGTVLYQRKEGNSYWITIEVRRGLSSSEMRERYGCYVSSPKHILLSPNKHKFFKDALDEGWNII